MCFARVIVYQIGPGSGKRFHQPGSILGRRCERTIGIKAFHVSDEAASRTLPAVLALPIRSQRTSADQLLYQALNRAHCASVYRRWLSDSTSLALKCNTYSGWPANTIRCL